MIFTQISSFHITDSLLSHHLCNKLNKALTVTPHLIPPMMKNKVKSLFNGLLHQILESSITLSLEEKKTSKMERNSVDGLTLSDGLMMVMMMIPLLYKSKTETLSKQEYQQRETYYNMLNQKDQLKST